MQIITHRTYLDDVFIQSQEKLNVQKQDMLKVVDKTHQVLLKKNMKADPDKSQFFLTLVNLLGHTIEGTTN